LLALSSVCFVRYLLVPQVAHCRQRVRLCGQRMQPIGQMYPHATVD
jgi:hypothetical protein